VVTAIGLIRLARWHGRCPACSEVGFAADALLGLDGYLTTRARRMATLAGLENPFRKAEMLLTELVGWSVDADTLRRCVHAEAARGTRDRPERAALPAEFAAASGDHEAQIDAGKVNTLGGWRDIKLAVFAVRDRAEPSSSSDYEQRDLPAPKLRSVIASVESAGDFGPRCRAEADRLGLTDPSRLSVLGDGAEWLWNLADPHFAGSAQVLDVYHATEYLAAAGRAALGGDALADWLPGARKRLVGDGYAGACEVMAGLPGGAEEIGIGLNYLAGHRDRLKYAARLCRGQSIGSGLVEGTIKQRVNLRLKRTGARWLAEGVGPFVEMLAMTETSEWNEYWLAQAA